MSLSQRIQHTLKQRRTASLYRSTRSFEMAQQPQRLLNGKTILTFCSNDYLGLANHPAVIQAFQQASNQYGVGSGAAHLVSGHTRLHQALEEALAAFTGRERALLFSTGYMANLGVVTALLDRYDTVFEDKLNHASLIDAGSLCGAKRVRYPHNNVAQLAKRLAHTETGEKLIVSDGVFSMDGDVAPMRNLAQLAHQYNAWLMVDDAHGLGVLGKNGAGVVEVEDLTQQDVPVLMGTLGKALGTAGAFVAGSQELIEYLIQTARPYIYTTGQPPAIAAASLASLKLVQTEAWRRDYLQQLIQRFRHGAQQLGLALTDSTTPIQPIILGSSEAALQASRQLEQKGILVTAIRPPTVPANTARLRVTLSAAHTEQELDQLLSALAQLAH